MYLIRSVQLGPMNIYPSLIDEQFYRCAIWLPDVLFVTHKSNYLEGSRKLAPHFFWKNAKYNTGDEVNKSYHLSIYKPTYYQIYLKLKSVKSRRNASKAEKCPFWSENFLIPEHGFFEGALGLLLVTFQLPLPFYLHLLVSNNKLTISINKL